MSDSRPQEVLACPSLLGFAFFLGWEWRGGQINFMLSKSPAVITPRRWGVESQKALANGACFLTQELERMRAVSLLPGCLHP